jgi:hypothetical protein
MPALVLSSIAGGALKHNIPAKTMNIVTAKKPEFLVLQKVMNGIADINRYRTPKP